MNARKAKKIRKEIYGDLSLRDAKYYRDKDGVLHRDATRKAYQQAKKGAA